MFRYFFILSVQRSICEDRLEALDLESYKLSEYLSNKRQPLSVLADLQRGDKGGC